MLHDELADQGIHVAHTAIGGSIAPGGDHEPEDVADLLWTASRRARAVPDPHRHLMGDQEQPVVSRGFRGRPPAEPERLPPGQYLTRDFPVLATGPTPIDAADGLAR